MTGEQIVGISTEELEAMTDEQLLAFFKDILVITRPQPKDSKVEDSEDEDAEESSEKLPKEKKPRKKRSTTSDTATMMAELLKIAAEKGIKI